MLLRGAWATHRDLVLSDRTGQSTKSTIRNCDTDALLSNVVNVRAMMCHFEYFPKSVSTLTTIPQSFCWNLFSTVFLTLPQKAVPEEEITYRKRGLLRGSQIEALEELEVSGFCLLVYVFACITCIFLTIHLFVDPCICLVITYPPQSDSNTQNFPSRSPLPLDIDYIS